MNTQAANLLPQAEPRSEPAPSGYPESFDAPALVAQLGGEVARALSSALERVNTLATTGQIDREGLRGLREEIDLARRTAMMGQQLVRLGSRDLRLSHERVDLTAMLREALQLRQRETRARGIEVRSTDLADIAMVSDAALVFSLIETLLDWCLEHARTRVVFKLQAKSNPTRARLACVFLRRLNDGSSTLDESTCRDPAMSTLSWRLMRQTAHVLGFSLRRLDTADRCEMRLSLPGADINTDTTLQDLLAEDIGPEQTPLSRRLSAPLAGRHLVVIATHRETRTLAGERFDRLRLSLLLEAPQMAFIEIAREGRDFEVREADGHPYACVGRDGLAESLPAALLFELSRHG